MTISAAEEKRLREIAERDGLDPDAFVAAARDEEANGADADAPDERQRGGNEDKAGAKEAAKKNDDDAPGPKVESGVTAHGGRGYFAYEFPFLRVNQVLEALFLPSVPDGDLFTGEWLAKHSAAPPKTNTDEGE